jgi:outer membrane protein assembly complex protein YaeT
MSKSAGDSEGRGGKHSAFSFFFFPALVIMSFLVSEAFSQDNQPPRISSVEVWVDSVPASGNMADLISVKKGDLYSLRTINGSVKQIYKTELFSDVEVIKDGQKQVGLKFVLTRKLLVRKTRFLGNKGISGRKLNGALYSLREDSFFSEEKLRRAKEELKRALNREGYFLPEIETAITRVPQAPDVDVIFTINAGKSFVIKNINFAGNGPVSPPDLRKKMKSRNGHSYVPSRLEQDITRLKSLYATLGFPRAEIELVDEKFNEEKGTVSLALKVIPNERIEIIITGAKVPVKIVEPIWQERIFEDWGLSEGEARILSYLRERGHIYAAVSSHLEKKDSEMRVIYKASPGQKIKVRDIRFEGNSYFSAKKIKDQLGIPEKVLWLAAIGGERVFELPEEIQTLYESQGFPDAAVTLNFVKEGKEVTAVFYIKEGAQQIISDISIQGAALFDPKTLLALVNLAKGGPYFPPDIQRGIQRLDTFYLNQGVRGTKIEAKTEAQEDSRFQVIFDIREGHKVKIQNLVITGNIVTKRKTIQKELRLKEGDYAYQEGIAASKRNLERLGVFSEVKVEEIPISPDEENLVITLREGQRNYASVGLGLETRGEGSSVQINDVRLRGTAEFMRSNIFGLAANLSFVSQFSLVEKRAVITWEQPYFLFSFPIQTYFNAWIEAEDRVSFKFNREGISLTQIRTIFDGLLLMTTLGYARTTLTYLAITESQVDHEFRPYSKVSLAPSFVKEKRNDVFNPERGYFGSLALEWAFPLFQTESNFLKGVFKYQRFFPIVPRADLGTTFRLGLGMGKMPIHERFFAGGSNSFRGQKFDELGPKDPVSGKPVGGKALLLFNFDLTFPVVSGLKDLSGAVFYDLGNVFAARNDFSLSNLEHAIGFGVRYRTPLGPVRLELGWNLTDPERKGKPILFMTIGNVF